MVGAKLTVAPEKAAEKDPRGVYRLYYDFNEPVARLVPHRMLALNRAEREDVLRVAVDVPFERAEPLISRDLSARRALALRRRAATRPSPMATSACSPQRWSARCAPS